MITSRISFRKPDFKLTKWLSPRNATILAGVAVIALTVACATGLVHRQKAEAFTPCSTTGVPVNYFPRANTGEREQAGCSSSDTYVWLSNYSPGSPLETPAVVFRVFFSLNDIAALGGNLGDLTFFTSPNPNRFVCGGVINVTVTNAAGANQGAGSIQKGPGCSNAVMPVINISAANLLGPVAEYGPNLKYMDVSLYLLGAQKNVPIKIIATSPYARITFRETDPNSSFTTAPNGWNTNPANYISGNTAIVGPDLGAFSVWSEDVGGGARETITYTFNFAPDCTLEDGATRNIFLRWYDADGDNPPNPTQDPDFGFLVIDDTAGGVQVPPANPRANVFTNLGGNDTYSELPITVTGGHHYRWIWSGVNRNNGVQIYMPYSEEMNDPDAICPPAFTNFVIQPTASYAVPGNDFENPGTFTYGGSIGLTASGKTVRANITQQLTLTRGGSTSTIASFSTPAQPFSAASTPLTPRTYTPVNPQTGDKYCSVVTANPRNGKINNSNGAQDPGPGAGADVTDTACFTVTNKPYVKAFGADVWASGAFDGSGTCTASAGIYAYAKKVGAGYVGSSVQYAAMANNSIDGFYSASNRTAAPTPALGLTFANSGPGVDTTFGPFGWGGSFGTLGICMPDYYNSAQDPAIRNGVFTSGVVPSGRHQYTLPGGSDLSSTGTITIPNGAQAAVFVDGDLYINSDVKYATGARNVASDIPYFSLVVRGNIYIGSNVHNLDGVYIAQQTDDSGGFIFTCAPSVGLLYADTDQFANCNSQLVVNGAFIANDIKLLRMFSSLRNGTSTENIVPATGTGTNAAEVFNFTPEMYVGLSPLRNVNLPAGGGANFGAYQAISSLPPVY